MSEQQVLEPEITQEEVDFGQRLREQTAAVRLRLKRLGTSKKLNAEQRERQAAAFQADPDYVRGTKRLLNTRQESYKKVVAATNTARKIWVDRSVPYPEQGIRLMHRDQVEKFEQDMRELQSQLDAAVVELTTVYRDLVVEEARERLGDLFDPSDYPETLEGCWQIDWDFPSVEPPDYLRQINPKLWEAQRDRIQQQFRHAVQLAEQEFVQELSSIVAHMVEILTPQEVHTYEYVGESAEEVERQIIANREARADISKTDEEQATLSKEHEALMLKLQCANSESITTRNLSLKLEAYPNEKLPCLDGKDRPRKSHSFASQEELDQAIANIPLRYVRTRYEQKMFKDSTVENFTEFFGRFGQLNIGSNQQIDELVSRAREALGETSASGLRKLGEEGRDNLRDRLVPIHESLESLAIDRPRRMINFDDDE